MHRSPTSHELLALFSSSRERRETHISWVFLDGQEVWKVKKPKNLGFLDFSRLERREEACRAEVQLNRRLAPDVYLGVVPIRRGLDGALHLGGGLGEVVDWAVHMRRLPDERRADVLVQGDRLTEDHLAAIAWKLAQFHEGCRSDEQTASFGARAVIQANIEENFAQVAQSRRSWLSAAEEAEIEERQRAFLSGGAALLEARAQAGRVRDGHGDLRLEHIYLDDDCPGAMEHARPETAGVRVLDGIEFNERFRFGDVASDVAFLSMDLALHRRVDLAERFLAFYARASGDYDLYRVVDFYESYRAYVRGKVSGLLAADEGAPAPARQQAADAAREAFLLALAAERKPVLPRVVVTVGGLPASGKTTVSHALARALQAPVVHTDWTRKQLVGAQPQDRLYQGAWSGAYDPGFTERVYDEVIARGRAVLRSGRPVVLDGSFKSAQERRLAKRLAEEEDVRFLFVQCSAPLGVCAARLEDRDTQSTVSDARPEILDSFLRRMQPPDELPADERVRLDTTLSLERSLQEVVARLPSWPLGLTG